MKKNILKALLLTPALIGAAVFLLRSGISVVSAQATLGGTLSFSPADVQNLGNFSINLNNGPSNKAPHLWISTSEGDDQHYGDFVDFGLWGGVSTDGSGNFSLNRQLKCNAYTSYHPGETTDLFLKNGGAGIKLYQQVKLQWPDASSSYSVGSQYSSVGSHVKDCLTPGAGAGILSCSAFPASVNPGHNVTFSAAGGGTYSWALPGGTPASGSGANITTWYSAVGTKTATVTSGANSATCTVSVGAAGGGQTLCGTPDPTKSGVCLLSNQVCQASGGNYSCVTPGGGGGPVGGLIDVRYSVTPNSGTVAVGQQISLKAFQAIGGETPTEVTDDNKWMTDSFYLKPGPTSGTFIGVNPGTVIVQYADLGGAARVPITVTGSPVAASGKISITADKDITDILFPQPGCTPHGKNCVNGGNNMLKVVPGDTGEQLVSEKWQSAVEFPAKGDTTNPMVYDLTDPFNPAVKAAGPVLKALGGNDDDYAGDYGPYLSITYGSAASKDASYQFAEQNQRMLFGFQDNTKRLLSFDGSGQVYSTVEYGDNVYLLTQNRIFKVTDLASMPTVTHMGGNPNPVETNWIENSAMNPPSNFPKMGSGPKLVLDDSYLAGISSTVTISGASVSHGNPKLQVFKLGRSSSVAGIDISTVLPASLGRENLGFLDPNSSFFAHKGADGTQYIFLLMAPSYNYGDYRSAYGARKLYGFKFDGTSLTKVIDGLALDPGLIQAATGIKVGSDVGIAVKLAKYLGIGAGGYATTENRVRIYLLSDLLAGTVQDVLSNSAVTTGLRGFISDKMTALERGGATYLYLSGGANGGRAPVYIWKLESGAGGAGGAGGGAGGGGGGGGPVRTGSCDFTLTATPQSQTLPQSSVFAVYSLNAPDNTDKTCTIYVTADSVKDNNGNRVISPSSASAAVVSPGSQTIIYFNLNSPAVGTYSIPIKAYSRGIPTKVLTPLGLTIQ